MRNLLLSKYFYKIQLNFTYCPNTVLLGIYLIIWTPGHSGIQGNVLVDAVAKRAAVGVPVFICVPYTDWYPVIREHINKEWGEKWNECNQFLYQSKPALDLASKTVNSEKMRLC